MADADVSERHRRASDASWAGLSKEQRRARTDAATKARGRVADVAEKVDALGTELLAELRALRTEVAELRAERIAA